MITLRSIYHLLRADFLERTRRYSFLVSLGLILFLAYGYIPSRDAGYITLAVDGARGLYNSAWVGSLVAILTGMTLPGLGFYLVKNAVARDAETGVGQIMATTRLTRPAYTLGKWLSNLAVLAVMLAVTALATIVLQLVLGEDRRLNLAALLAPLLWVTLPTLALVAALALLFETIGWLSGGLGNVVYFFICTAVTMGSFLPVMIGQGRPEATPWFRDIFGIGLPLSAMLRATAQAFPALDSGNNSIGPVPVSLSGPLQTFVWAGVRWTPPVIASRLLWIGAAFGVTLLAALFFKRFDPSRAVYRAAKRASTAVDAEPAARLAPAGQLQARLTPLYAAPRRFGFGRVLLAELRLIRKGLPGWWSLIAVALIMAACLAPADVVKAYLLPAAWLWPILVWSGLGAREARHHTQGLIFSTANPLLHQLPAAWLAGAVVAALSGSGAAFTFLRAGDGASLVAWSVAVLFIPALAVALAVWSGSSKLFEVAYLALWYFGPLNQIAPQLDFIGPSGATAVYALSTVGLLGAAVLGRRRQLRG